MFDLGADGKGMKYVACLSQDNIAHKAAATTRSEIQHAQQYCIRIIIPRLKYSQQNHIEHCYYSDSLFAVYIIIEINEMSEQ